MATSVTCLLRRVGHERGMLLQRLIDQIGRRQLPAGLKRFDQPRHPILNSLGIAAALIAAWDRVRPGMVIGSRLADPARIPGVRFWTNYIGSRILSWMTGRELLDSQSGYRLLDAGLASRLRLSADGYAIESEMLIKATRLGARLEHVRVRTIYNDHGSHFRPVLDTFRISCASIYYKVFDDAG